MSRPTEGGVDVAEATALPLLRYCIITLLQRQSIFYQYFATEDTEKSRRNSLHHLLPCSFRVFRG